MVRLLVVMRVMMGVFVFVVGIVEFIYCSARAVFWGGVGRSVVFGISGVVLWLRRVS